MPFWRSRSLEKKQREPFWRTQPLKTSQSEFNRLNYPVQVLTCKVSAPILPASSTAAQGNVIATSPAPASASIAEPFWRSGEKSSTANGTAKPNPQGPLFWRSSATATKASDSTATTGSARFWRSSSAVDPSTSTSTGVFWRSRALSGPNATSSSSSTSSPLLSSANSTVVDDDTSVPDYDEKKPFANSPLSSVPALNTLLGKRTDRLVSTSTVVEALAYSISSHVYVYETGADIGNSINAWSKSRQTNFAGVRPHVYNMQIRSGAAIAILSALDASKGKAVVSAFTNSSGLLSMLPQLYQLSASKSASSPFVIHVAAHDVDDNLTNVANYADIVLARDTDAVVIASHSIHEAGQVATAAYGIARKTGKVVVHVYAGSDAGTYASSGIDLEWATAATWNKVNAQVNSVPTTRRTDNASLVENILGRVGGVTSAPLSSVSYQGHASAEKVFVAFGTKEVSDAFVVARDAAAKGSKVGVLGIRAFCPLSEEYITGAIPHTASKIVVLEQVDDINESQSVLYQRVVNSFALAGLEGSARPAISVLKYDVSQALSRSQFASLFEQLQASQPLTFGSAPSQSAVADKAKVCVFLGEDTAANVAAPIHLANVFAKDSQLSVGLSRSFDNYFDNGVFQARLAIAPVEVDADLDRPADFVSVDADLLLKVDILPSIRQNGTLLVVSDVAHDKLESKIPSNVRRAAIEQGISLFALNIKAIVEDAKLGDDTASVALQAAFLHIYTHGQSARALDTLIAQFYAPDALKRVSEVVDRTVDNLVKVKADSAWKDLEVEKTDLPISITANGFAPNLHKSFDDAAADSFLSSWSTAAKHILFNEAFATDKQLRPDLPERNFVVKVTENKRLTPTTYDRNVFHMELDTTGTGLKYDIGEALGVHGFNDANDVHEFIKWYNLNPDELVTVPNVSDPFLLETRTVFQALQQNLDIFGKPPKKFYEELAHFATDKKEMRKIAFVGSGDGKIIYKKRSEEWTLTYADVLQEFPSARPSFADLARLVAPIKPRHYSIASSQHMHPNSVHLLVVTVDWQDTQGRTRYGQCTRYLAGLSIGDEVTVSIKPSVMKLPPLTTQPIIMAGLGTGMAPFRAFLQEREYQRMQGHKVGPLALYFGSRYRSQEYLYGEEIESYAFDGLLTHLGLAFSRDSDKKVYIQHKMKEDKDLLRKWLLEEEGYFYLCGPTWPVPDVGEAMMAALSSGGIQDPAAYIEELKEHERYVLEVY